MKTTHHQRIGIYGGTFAPVHYGHLHAAKAFLTQFQLDRLLFMPVRIPPHKQLDFQDDPQARLEMLRLATNACFKDTRIEVSDYEISRAGKSYTYQTVEAFLRKDRTLFLYMGTDMFLSFDQWRFPERICAGAHLVVARREQEEAKACQIEEKRRQYQRDYHAEIHILELEPFVISSTEIRQKLRNHESVTDKIPSCVQNYIYTHGCFGVSPLTNLPS